VTATYQYQTHADEPHGTKRSNGYKNTNETQRYEKWQSKSQRQQVINGKSNRRKNHDLTERLALQSDRFKEQRD